MSIFASLLGLSPEEYIKQGDDFFGESRFGEAKVEYEKAEELLPSSNTEKKEYITEKIKQCCDKLCDLHLEMSRGYVESKEFEKAISELETAFELCEAESQKSKDIHKELDRVRIKMYQFEADKQAEPYILRGDEFMKEESYTEAMVEYREAIKTLKYYQESEDEFKRSAKEKLVNCEVKIVEPYIERARNFEGTKMYDEALDELNEAREIIDELDETNKTRMTINKMIFDIYKKKGQQAGEEISEEEFVSKQEWDEAINEYKELLSLYFNYSYSENDPYYPVHQNKYEEEFKTAKKRLAGLYCKRADGNLSKQKYAMALKYYLESQNLFNEETPEYKYVMEQIENCKRNIK
ncbi:MAG: hypothetical protein QMC67_02240 [Candidatus Wallbacteria bacterium]